MENLEEQNLTAWFAEQEAEKAKNQAEADALAIIIAEERLKPTLEERVSENDTNIVSIEEAIDVIFG